MLKICVAVDQTAGALGDRCGCTPAGLDASTAAFLGSVVAAAPPGVCPQRKAAFFLVSSLQARQADEA